MSLDILRNKILGIEEKVPLVKDDTFQRKLSYLTQNADYFGGKYGKAEYDRYLNYYTTKANVEKYGIDQTLVSPSLAKVDDLINNRPKYESKYGKSGFDRLYSMTLNLSKDDISAIDNAIKLKQSGAYDYNLLSHDWKDAYTYTDSEEDQNRKRLNLVPLAFQDDTKAILEKAKVYSTMSPQERAAALLNRSDTFLSSRKAANAPITEEQLKEAMDVISQHEGFPGESTALNDIKPNNAVEQGETQEAEETNKQFIANLFNTNFEKYSLEQLRALRENVETGMIKANKDTFFNRYTQEDNPFLKLGKMYHVVDDEINRREKIPVPKTEWTFENVRRDDAGYYMAYADAANGTYKVIPMIDEGDFEGIEFLDKRGNPKPVPYIDRHDILELGDTKILGNNVTPKATKLINNAINNPQVRDPKYNSRALPWYKSMLAYTCMDYAIDQLEQHDIPDRSSLKAMHTSLKDTLGEGYMVSDLMNEDQAKNYKLIEGQTMIAMMYNNYGDYHFMKKHYGGNWIHKYDYSAPMVFKGAPWEYGEIEGEFYFFGWQTTGRFFEKPDIGYVVISESK